MLCDKIERLIAAESTQIAQFDADECNVSPGGWIETRRSERGNELARGLMLIFDFHEQLLEVRDMREAERAVEAMRLSD